MDFTITQRIGAALDTVEAALLDPDVIAAAQGLPKLGGSELVSEERDGSRVHLKIRRRFTGELNSAVTRVVDPAKLTWIEDIVYDLDSHTGKHRIVPDNYADRLESRYTTALDGDAGTTVRTTAGTLKVRAPLVGGRVERAIVSGLDEYAQAEAQFLTDRLTAIG